MTASLKGKVALVTGGSRGIGAAIAERLAADGADVAIGYGSAADRANAVVAKLTGLNVRAAAFQADQADPKAVAGLVAAVLAQFGRLDILVNSAGVFAMGSVADPAGPELDMLQKVNVGGVVAAVRAAAPHLPAGGRIITVGSSVASFIGLPGMSDYAATKAAVASYTRGWARDLGPKGVTVNVVQPGPVDTDMNPAGGPFAATMTAMVALGRYGRVEEVAAAVAFLAGPEASYITGAALNVDGGFAA